MKILLLGKDGQVGWELQRTLSTLGELISSGRQQVDIEDEDALRQHIRLHRPDVVVNAAAYTAVDKAESEQDKAHLINAHAVRVLAEESARLDAWLVHYSSDYVFDGSKSTPYLEADPTAPLNVYGESKALGENAVRNSGCKHLILRSSWVYSAYGSNFPLAILRRARDADRINVVDDSFGAPTKADLIADTTALMLYRIGQTGTKDASGTYHLSASGATSWYEYALFLVDLARQKGLPIKLTSDQILPVSGDEYPTAARRPRNCRIDNTKLQEAFGLTLPDWRAGVARLIDELVKR